MVGNREGPRVPMFDSILETKKCIIIRSSKLSKLSCRNEQCLTGNCSDLEGIYYRIGSQCRDSEVTISEEKIEKTDLLTLKKNSTVISLKTIL